MSVCSIEGCGRPEDARTWCKMHWKRWRKHGDPMGGGRHYSDPVEALNARTEWQGSCRVWTGSLTSAGYGNIRIGERNQLVHRFAWQQVHGPAPAGFDLDHKCHNRACVNPEHLRLATRKQNLENHQGPTAASTTGVRGVYRTKRGRWTTQTTHHRQRYSAGNFATIEEAERAIVALRNELHTRNDTDRIAQ